MRLSDLLPGARVLIAGVEYELLHVNECRAHVRLVRGTSVTIAGETFQRSTYTDVSPTTEVDSVIRLGVAAVVEPAVEAAEVKSPVVAAEELADYFASQRAALREAVAAAVRGQLLTAPDRGTQNKRAQLGLGKKRPKAGSLPLFAEDGQQSLF